MIRRFLRRVRVNFRQSASDRKATLSYRGYHQRAVQLFKRMPPFRKKK
ncbi:MAG: hypothetical protein ACM3IJ_01665 [Candidatus Levyibacteriota bacterium]